MMDQSTPTMGALNSSREISAMLKVLLSQYGILWVPGSSIELIADLIDRETGAVERELTARLIERTEQSMATALRDAEIIRQLTVSWPKTTPAANLEKSPPPPSSQIPTEPFQ